MKQNHLFSQAQARSTISSGWRTDSTRPFGPSHHTGGRLVSAICKHLVPWTHSLARRSPTSVESVCSPLGVSASQGSRGWEPLDRWRDYSREAKEITLDAIALKNSRARPQDRLELLFLRVAAWLELAAVPLVTYAEVDEGEAWPCGFQAKFAITGEG